MSRKTFLVARCGRFDLRLDLHTLILYQDFLADVFPDRCFQLSMLEVLSFLDVVDKFNTEQLKIQRGIGDPYWCQKLLAYIEKSYLVKEIELSR